MFYFLLIKIYLVIDMFDYLFVFIVMWCEISEDKISLNKLEWMYLNNNKEKLFRLKLIEVRWCWLVIGVLCLGEF